MEVSIQNLADAISKYNLKVPPPSPYKSSELLGDLNSFLKQFEKYAASIHGDDLYAHLQILPQFLEGEARHIVEAFGPSAPYDVVKERLIREFTHRNILGSNEYSDLFMTNRNPDESLVCYSLRLTAMARKIPNSTKQTKDELVKLKFMSVLPNNVSKKIIYHFCNEIDPPIDKIVRLASILESHESTDMRSELNSHPRIANISIPEKVNPVHVKPRLNPNGKKCFVCKSIYHFISVCPVAKRTKCYNCNLLGHVSKNCLYPPKKTIAPKLCPVPCEVYCYERSNLSMTRDPLIEVGTVSLNGSGGSKTNSSIVRFY